MIQAAEVQRDECGYWIHPEWDRFCGGREYVPRDEVEAWLKRHGLEIVMVRLEGEEESHPAYQAYYEQDNCDMSVWELSPPAGKGWFLLSIHDTEDGPVQVWARQAEVWSVDGERFNHDSLDQLLEERDDIREGSTLYHGTKQPLVASAFVDADRVIEDMGERAYDEVGDLAEDYPEVTPEAKHELQAFLERWAEKHCTPNFWLVDDIEEHVVTAEEMARVRPAEEGTPS